MRRSLWKVKAYPRPHSLWTRQGAQILSALAPLTQTWPSSGIWELTFCSFTYIVLLFSKQEFWEIYIQNKVSYAFSFSIVTFKKRLSHITILEGQRMSTFFSPPALFWAYYHFRSFLCLPLTTLTPEQPNWWGWLQSRGRRLWWSLHTIWWVSI